MTDRDRPERPEADAPVPTREDTEAILSRRAFLIETALASAGLAAVAGCEKPQPTGRPTQPQVCLKGPLRRDTGVPTVCLSVAPPEPDAATPQVCLKVAPPPDAATPQPCLSVPAPMTPPPPRPTVCLSKPPPRKPPATICLSDIDVP